MLIARHFHLSRSKTLRFLQELDKSESNALSIYLPPNVSKDDVGNLLLKVPGTAAIPPDLPELVVRSRTGAAIFWGLQSKYLVIPPFPLTEKYVTNGYDTEPLISLLKHDFTIALVLVRLGSYAVGVSKGEKLIASKVGTGLVHGRHRQGGSSSARFQRRRENQIDHFLDRVCEKVLEKIQPHASAIDYFVYGGARTTILTLQKQCPFLSRFDDRTLPPLLEIPEPKQAVLESAIEQVWSSQISEWLENQP